MFDTQLRSRFRLRAGWPRCVSLTLCLASLALNPAFAHKDPPTDPPLLVEQDLTTLTFLTDVDDGTNGTAELVVLYTIDWGGDHGKTLYLWKEDHNFDTIAPPYSPVPPRLVLGTHAECTPRAAPAITADAYESDSGLDALAGILIGAGGGAVGGVLGTFLGPGYGTAAGAAAGGAVAAGVGALVADFFNSDDVLVLNTDFTTTGAFSTVALPAGPCSSTASGYKETTQQMFCSASLQTTDSDAALRYVELATYGVDGDFPFGRNYTYSSGRYAMLKTALTDADAMTLESGGTSDIAAKQGSIRTAAADIGRVVAAATIDEAIAMAIAPSSITAAQSALAAGDTAIGYGDYTLGVAYYDDVGQLLLPAMFPEFASPSSPCSTAVPAGSAVNRLLLIGLLALLGASSPYLRSRLARAR